MGSPKKIRVAVLYGGRSGEHEISLQSAASVIRNLDPQRFEIVPIAIDKQGRWLLNDVSSILSSSKSLPIFDDVSSCGPATQSHRNRGERCAPGFDDSQAEYQAEI